MAGENNDRPPPVIEGTLIRVAVDHLSDDRSPEPPWLWSSRVGAYGAELDGT